VDRGLQRCSKRVGLKTQWAVGRAR